MVSSPQIASSSSMANCSPMVSTSLKTKTLFRYVVAILLLSLFQTPSAQAETDTRDGIFDSAIRTVSLRNPDNFMAPPVIRLGTHDRLLLNFDIIGDAHEYLRYRLIHCNADWQPSRLLESEYIDGFNEGEISDFAYSSNTFVHYVNYNLVIPNEDMPIIAGGNYLLQVYDEENPDNTLLQTRFSVSENGVAVRPTVTTRTDRGFNTEWQQLDLAIDLTGLGNVNPYQDFIITVTQNNRPEITHSVTHPLRVDGNVAIFEHDQNLIFPASNEYRRFETVRVDYPGMSVDSVVFGGTNWHAYLKPDEPRCERNYIYDHTQHGRFMIDEYNATDADLGADYVTVHFTLDSPEIIGGDVYVDGDFNLHRFDSRNKMSYDYTTRRYTAQIPLKQGSYNYQYVVVDKKHNDAIPDSFSKADSGIIEGNYYETENEYLVKVYYRPPGARADRLIGTN